MDTLFTYFSAPLLDPERIPYAFVAILLTILVGVMTGPPGGNAYPFLWGLADAVLGGLGDRLDKARRPRADLVFRGFLLTAIVLFLVLGGNELFKRLILNNNVYGIAEPLLLSLLLTSGSVWFVLLRLYFALENKSVGKGAFYAVSRSTRRNLAVADDFGITRAGMGLAARSFDKGMVSPVFWYLIGGLPVALVYAALAGLAWRFGKDGFSKGFGAVPMALERLMGFIPSAFAALLLGAASVITPTAGIARSVASWAGMKNRAPYEQGGLPLSTIAWALKVSLGGAGQDLGGSAVQAAWVGPEGATARLDHKHLRRALYLNVIAHFLFMASLAGAYLWSGMLPRG